MSAFASIAIVGPTLMACTAARHPSNAPSADAPGRVETFGVVMPELSGRSRIIRVYLPRGYDRARRAYPVLYLQDAQQLFAPGPFGDWRIDETLDSLVGTGRFAGIIVVGIDNSPHRWGEYGPWANHHMRDWIDSSWAQAAEGGDGAAYLRFMVNTLKPHIDGRYRTLPGREHTGIGGSSMGGLIAVYAGLTRPDVFSKVMAMSTAVWFAEDGGPWLSRNRLLALASSAPPPRNVRFSLDVGTEERSRDTDPAVVDSAGQPVTYPRAYLEGTAALAQALIAGGVPAENVRHVVDDGAIHHESAWARRVGDVVLWLYHEDDRLTEGASAPPS